HFNLAHRHPHVRAGNFISEWYCLASLSARPDTDAIEGDSIAPFRGSCTVEIAGPLLVYTVYALRTKRDTRHDATRWASLCRNRCWRAPTRLSSKARTGCARTPSGPMRASYADRWRISELDELGLGSHRCRLVRRRSHGNRLVPARDNIVLHGTV